ncbi:MAG: DUF4097 family beta strand repeat-containing protein [Halobacterium sp.]
MVRTSERAALATDVADISGCLGRLDAGLETEARRLAAEPGDRVSVHTPAGAVTVGSGEQGRLRASSREPFAVRTEHADGALRVLVDTDAEARVDLALALPAGVELDSVATGRGAVAVRDVAGAPVVQTDRGDVDVADTTGLSAVYTGAGDVSVSVPTIRGEATVETASGDATVVLPDGVDATVECSVRGGAVSSPTDCFDEVAQRAPGYLRGVLGDGDAWLTAKTGDGDARLRRA